MRPINFKEIQVNDLWVYELIATQNKWFDRTLWSNNTKLYKKLLEDYEINSSGFDYLFDNLSYNNSTHEENIFIYEKIIWSLLSDKDVYIIIRFKADSFLNMYNLPFEYIKWEYNVKSILNKSSSLPEILDLEFQPAITGKISSISTFSSSENSNKTPLFRIGSFVDFVNILKCGIGDDNYSINIFGIESDDSSKLSNILNSNKKPNLDEILGKDGIFINLNLGSDEGYIDHLIIKSKIKLLNQISVLTKIINFGINNYENEIENIASFKDLVQLIDECFELKILPTLN